MKNKHKSVGTELKIEKKEELIKRLKQAKTIFGAVTLYITGKGIITFDSIIRDLIDNKTITIHTKNGILFLCIGVSWFFFYKINGEIKYQMGQYLDLNLENAFANMREEMHIEHTTQKTL